MNAESKNNAKYMILKAFKGGKSIFLDVADEEAVETFRNEHENKDLFVSTCLYSAPDPSAECTYPLYFYLASNNLERTCVSTLEAYYYISEHFNIPEDCLEPCYDGDATMLIIVPPVVFDSWPTPFMPAVNYHLARQMVDDGITNIDIDVYQWDYLIPLPNSINSGTGRFAIPLTMKELLYLDGKAIAELAKKPKPENSLIMPTPATEAAEWYAEMLAEFKIEQRRQDDLREKVLDKGWEVPSCTRQLMRLCLYDHNRLEAYRIISQFFAWINAGPAEIRQVIHAVDRRNPLRDRRKIDEIVDFAAENPWFAGCQHHLLRQFCPAGGCFMAELVEKCARPCLFEDP